MSSSGLRKIKKRETIIRKKKAGGKTPSNKKSSGRKSNGNRVNNFSREASTVVIPQSNIPYLIGGRKRITEHVMSGGDGTNGINEASAETTGDNADAYGDSGYNANVNSNGDNANANSVAGSVNANMRSVDKIVTETKKIMEDVNFNDTIKPLNDISSDGKLINSLTNIIFKTLTTFSSNMTSINMEPIFNSVINNKSFIELLKQIETNTVNDEYINHIIDFVSIIPSSITKFTENMNREIISANSNKLRNVNSETNNGLSRGEGDSNAVMVGGDPSLGTNSDPSLNYINPVLLKTADSEIQQKMQRKRMEYENVARQKAIIDNILNIQNVIKINNSALKERLNELRVMSQSVHDPAIKKVFVELLSSDMSPEVNDATRKKLNDLKKNLREFNEKNRMMQNQIENEKTNAVFNTYKIVIEPLIIDFNKVLTNFKNNVNHIQTLLNNKDTENVSGDELGDEFSKVLVSFRNTLKSFNGYKTAFQTNGGNFWLTIRRAPNATIETVGVNNIFKLLQNFIEYGIKLIFNYYKYKTEHSIEKKKKMLTGFANNGKSIFQQYESNTKEEGEEKGGEND